MRRFFKVETESFHARYRDVKERASSGLEDIDLGLRRLYQDRKIKLKEAKKRIKLLPREYRIIGKREYALFKQRLDEFMEPAGLPVSAM